ncbi:MAG TPA: adenylate/guanylate cyclase domain-containing protein [Chthoniobacterales bacterium]|nr:adenylate/guanylate cyclase domain-containing protein [Chthoniobacterales bacterium]
MKRHLLTALIIAVIAGGIVMGLHRGGALLRPELAIVDLLSRQTVAARMVSEKWHYVFVFILAFGVALMTLMSTRRARLGAIVAILLVELAGVAWVCSLYSVLFQPLPSLAGTILGFLMPIGYLEILKFLQRRRERAPVLSVEAVSVKPRARVKRGEFAPDSVAQACEVTAVVCDIANKHDLAEECEPAAFAEITEKFLAHATEAFRKAGAYIESAGGEGVVAIFGFPESDKQHAEKATRKAMALTQAYSDSNKAGKSDGPASIGVHAGVSSGIMIMAPVKNNGQRSMLATGEPVELARRFCIANRFYGSRVLLGPRTFELASKILVARPIDFLSGVDVRERHEIYEPVALALEASRDQITRRDAFWNGVVLYREKRWAEAYSQFQNARGPEGEEDRPLQLYLRRLEPLALQLTNTPLDE